MPLESGKSRAAFEHNTAKLDAALSKCDAISAKLGALQQRRADAWSEADHPRAPDGKFGSGGGGSGSSAAASRPFDHGELNIPLNKRQGDINAQLDRYFKEQRALAESKRKETAADTKAHKALAKTAYEEMGPAIVEKYGGGKLGSAKAVRDTLESMVKWEPKKFLALANKFREETAGARAA